MVCVQRTSQRLSERGIPVGEVYRGSERQNDWRFTAKKNSAPPLLATNSSPKVEQTAQPSSKKPFTVQLKNILEIRNNRRQEPIWSYTSLYLYAFIPHRYIYRDEI